MLGVSKPLPRLHQVESSHPLYKQEMNRVVDPPELLTAYWCSEQFWKHPGPSRALCFCSTRKQQSYSISRQTLYCVCSHKVQTLHLKQRQGSDILKTVDPN